MGSDTPGLLVLNGRRKQGEQAMKSERASKKHVSKASVSVHMSRFLPRVCALTSLDDVRCHKPICSPSYYFLLPFLSQQ